MRYPHDGTVLMETKTGWTIWCPHCQAIHLQFGNALVTFGQRRGLQTFHREIDAARLSAPTKGSEIISLDAPHVAFTFSVPELGELAHLLEGTEAMIASGAVPEFSTSD